MQRWFCTNCRQSITFRREANRQHFSDIFITEAVKDFIQGRSSYGVIQERKGVAVGTLSSWVHDFGSRCLAPVEIAEKLNLKRFNKWSGILLLDGKYISRECLLLLAVDYLTLDVIAWIVVEAETEKNYISLIDLVEKCGYKIKALISDGHPGITALTIPKKPRVIRKWTRTYPRPGILPAIPPKARLENIPHQWCCIHAECDIKQMVAKTKKRTNENYDGLLTLTHSILFAKTLISATRYKQQLMKKVSSGSDNLYLRVAAFLLFHWENLMLHHQIRVNGRKIPRDSNCIENVIAYINVRLKTLRKLRTKKSAIPITNLIVVNYRTKPFRNPKNKLKRGKSPLDLATNLNKHFYWTDFIRKPTA